MFISKLVINLTCFFKKYRAGDNIMGTLLIAIIRYFNYLPDTPDEEIVITDYWHQFLLLFTEILAIIIIITTI